MGADLGWVPFLLQTADALFPTGAYAHSLGFEEAVRLGMVRDETSLAEFLELHISPALEEVELPYLRFSIEAAAADDVEELCALDHRISAWKVAKETREASLQIGGRRLQALRGISQHPLLERYAACIEDRRALGHHLIVSAIQAVAENVPEDAALAAYAYQTHAAICAASLKLIRIGQQGCQRVLRGATLQLPELVERSRRIEPPDAGTFSPLLDIASMRHERSFERLFIS
ncbi:MAG: urease accessory protein UreF [Chthoniobacteraceae bacterium]